MNRPLALASLLALCSACSGPDLQRLDERAAPFADDERPAMRAAQADYQGARAHALAPSVWERTELRLGGLSPEGIDAGQGIDLAARLILDNPWEESATEDAHLAELEGALARIESTALTLEVERCERSIRAHVSAELRALNERHAAQLQALKGWVDAWLEAGQLNELEGARARLALSTALAELETGEDPFAQDASTDYPLPAIGGRPLTRDADTLRELLRAHHPALQELEAEGKRESALAEGEQASRFPWLDFLELRYELGESASAITGQIAVEIPFGFEAIEEAERHEALAERARFEALAIETTLLRATAEELQKRATIEARGDLLRELEREADEAEAIALRWQEERLGEPRAVARLFDEVSQAREAVLEQRLRAGMIGCALLALTGVSPVDWPRGP